MTTFLSTIALRTTALRPTLTLSISTLPVDLGPGVHASPTATRIDRSTVPPETTAPLETIESTACPIRPCRVVHELGRRQRVVRGVDRPVVVVEVEDRVDGDQVHVRVVERVQRPDVAPVVPVALGASRARRCRGSRRRCASPRSTSIGMMLPPMSCLLAGSSASLAQRVEQRVGGEDVVAHRRVDLVGCVGQARRRRSASPGRRAIRRRSSAVSMTPNWSASSMRLPDGGDRHAGAGVDVLRDHLAAGPSGRCGRRRRRSRSRAARRRSG